MVTANLLLFCIGLFYLICFQTFFLSFFYADGMCINGELGHTERKA